MEKLDLILHLVTFLLVFAPFLIHGEKALSSIHVSNSEKDDTSSNLKILKVKRRETDYCERVIRNYSSKKRSSCSSFDEINAACKSSMCKTRPSRPAELSYVIRPNNTTKMVDLHVTWKKPKNGSSALCGFQINIASLKNHFYTTCIQFNSKSLFSYSFPGLSYNGRFNITITNLPPENDAESSNFISVKSPDRCTVLKQLNESLPWTCEVTNNFPVACKNGSFNVTLERLHKAAVDRYYCTLIRRGSGKQEGPDRLQSKDHPFAAYSNLTLNVEYVLSVILQKGKAFHLVRSQPFTCKDITKTSTTSTTATAITKTEATTPYSSGTTTKKDLVINGMDLLWKVLLPITFCILLVLLLVICIRGKVLSKLRERFRTRYRRAPPDIAEGMQLREKEKVDL